jgi:AraC family transcriptional regulator, regulatory protein of adaptative response / methylated-DNA-[protein]-cysteine methyltransferase
MERAYLERDWAYDGIFFLGVRTTGVFCRPTCAARKPKPENVEYFPTQRDAMAAGYRPCKRCRPTHADGEPDWVKGLLDDVERSPSSRITEADLRRRGIDPSTARRYFHKEFGMTFQAYARSIRLGLALSRIREGAEIDDVVFDSGYDSHSGFRDAFVRVFGKAPGGCREQDCISIGWIRSPLGPLVAGATSTAICLLEFTDRRMLEGQFNAIKKLFAMPVVPRPNALIEKLEAELDLYFQGKLRKFTVPLTYPGTPFQQRVWRELLRIPYGETRSYEEIAVALGAPQAQRAVGRTNGLNRIAIVIPCHRVVNKDGGLGGYGGGLRRKQYLLDLEKRNKQYRPEIQKTKGSMLPLR